MYDMTNALKGTSLYINNIQNIHTHHMHIKHILSISIHSDKYITTLFDFHQIHQI